MELRNKVRADNTPWPSRKVARLYSAACATAENSNFLLSWQWRVVAQPVAHFLPRQPSCVRSHDLRHDGWVWTADVADSQATCGYYLIKDATTFEAFRCIGWRITAGLREQFTYYHSPWEHHAARLYQFIFGHSRRLHKMEAVLGNLDYGDYVDNRTFLAEMMPRIGQCIWFAGTCCSTFQSDFQL